MMSKDVLSLSLSRPQQKYLVFLALILFQGFHELEHIVQAIQRFVLGDPTGNGLVGSLFDIEPVHFVYNTGFLALLIATYLLLGLHRGGRKEYGTVVFALLTFAVVAQSWHELEHVAKITEYFQLGYRNGVGGILGIGPGAIRPTFNLVWLHLFYNTVAYTPVLVAYLVSGMHRLLTTDLARARHPAIS